MARRDRKPRRKHCDLLTLTGGRASHPSSLVDCLDRLDSKKPEIIQGTGALTRRSSRTMRANMVMKDRDVRVERIVMHAFGIPPPGGRSIHREQICCRISSRYSWRYGSAFTGDLLRTFRSAPRVRTNTIDRIACRQVEEQLRLA